MRMFSVSRVWGKYLSIRSSVRILPVVTSVYSQLPVTQKLCDLLSVSSRSHDYLVFSLLVHMPCCRLPSAHG